MIFYYQRSWALVLTIFILCGCETNPLKGLPDVGVSKQEINSRIHLWIYGAGDKPFMIKNHESMMVGVDVKPPDHVAFPRDYNVRLFVNEDSKWIEITNETTYDESLPEMEIVPADNYFLSSGDAGVNPYYPNLMKETPLRIVVIGKLVRDGKVTEEKTAGSIDVILEP